jgi:hypothetical protein
LFASNRERLARRATVNNIDAAKRCECSGANIACVFARSHIPRGTIYAKGIAANVEDFKRSFMAKAGAFKA